MKDSDLDRAYERESDRLWEALNARDESWDRKLDAVAYMNTALDNLNAAIVRFYGAKDQLEGMPEEDRLGSLLYELEDLTCDLQAMRNRFKDGE